MVSVLRLVHSMEPGPLLMWSDKGALLSTKGRTPSTLKVYVATIAAFHAHVAGQSLGRNNLVVHFLNPPRPPSVPVWDLSMVLEAMKGALLQPLQSADLKPLSLKTALLLALASVK